MLSKYSRNDMRAEPDNTPEEHQPKMTLLAEAMPNFPTLSLVETKFKKDLIWLGWTEFESGEASWWQTGGDGGNAYGRYQFDKRCWLGKFLTYCAEMSDDYAGLLPYANSDGTAKDDGTLAEAWRWICHVKSDEFFALQTDFALDEYYYPVKEQLLEIYDIDLDDYGPVLKGTVWSVAIRDGYNVSKNPKNNRLKSVTETYFPGIDEQEWLEKIYEREAERHEIDPGRWSERQKAVALEVYEALQDETEDKSINTEMLHEKSRTILSR